MIDKVEECTQIISDKIFFIMDDKENEPPYIVDNNGEFEIINNTKKEISFIAIDSCIYESKDDTRCDCAIHDNKTFCFIELKHTKRTAWKKRREDALKQLENTIKEFNKYDMIGGKSMEAYMCCTCKIDNNYTKIIRAKNTIETETYFTDILNTNLYCDNKKEFN